jgi:hypothetical protein
VHGFTAVTPAGVGGTPERSEGMSVDQPPPPHRLYRITPTRTEPRAPALPPHDGPDSASAAVLDGPTALRRALDRVRVAREALGERRPSPPVLTHPADVDDADE